MRLLAFSDVHCDLGAVESLVERAKGVDVVAGVGDFASVHEGLEQTLAPLWEVEAPVVLVPGNNETEDALRGACEGWDGVTVLHGEGTQIDGVAFYGLGAGVPTTPWDWSFDLTEEQAEEMLAGMPEGAVLLSHSPPKGHVDKGLGSEAVLRAGGRSRAVLCGHIHEQWGGESRIGEALVRNLGPDGYVLEL
ncbi:MAG: metallophosphoesterase family protein [Thermoleophilaceae bacterium]